VTNGESSEVTVLVPVEGGALRGGGDVVERTMRTEDFQRGFQKFMHALRDIVSADEASVGAFTLEEIEFTGVTFKLKRRA
jgi:hypothetical protein